MGGATDLERTKGRPSVRFATLFVPSTKMKPNGLSLETLNSFALFSLSKFKDLE